MDANDLTYCLVEKIITDYFNGYNLFVQSMMGFRMLFVTTV